MRNSVAHSDFHVAIVGDGSTAVNTLDALVHELSAGESLGRPVSVSVYGKAGSSHVGKGYAYGPEGSRVGNLTEPANAGHADYTREKGAFSKFSRGIIPPEKPEVASRKLIGEFHAQRYRDTLRRAGDLGINVQYHQLEVTNIVPRNGRYDIITQSGKPPSADHVVVAVGDILSKKFNIASRRFPQNVFNTPYQAFDPILSGHTADKVTVAFGTRSSFVDLANGLKKEGYQGQIIGVSSTGLTSWPTTASRKAAYTPQHLLPENAYRTTADVLKDLARELKYAQSAGAYVPDDLVTSIKEQSLSGNPQRPLWSFDHRAEKDAAGQATYHQVSQSIEWEALYEGLADQKEKELFHQSLGDFILYNRVNRIVSADFNALAGIVHTTELKLEKGSFTQHDITRTTDNRLQIALDGHGALTCDYVVNCAIGPVSALEQVKHHTLLSNLTAQGLISPHARGTGFTVNDRQGGITLAGAQARSHAFSGLGIETYGRHIQERVIPHIMENLGQRRREEETNNPPALIYQEIKYG